jgi:hypothetical protein
MAKRRDFQVQGGTRPERTSDGGEFEISMSGMTWDDISAESEVQRFE